MIEYYDGELSPTIIHAMRLWLNAIETHEVGFSTWWREHGGSTKRWKDMMDAEAEECIVLLKQYMEEHDATD